MGLRGVASQLARASSGVWQGVADAIDPPRREPEREREPGPEPSPPAGPTTHDTAPEGAMLVPLDTWTRILEQIGNVHEAGQQLADARERAARAETENEFLRAQIADLKERTRKRAAPKPGAPVATDPSPATPSSAAVETRTRRRVRLARERAGRWISP